jgi:EAL domain-containing protein (putative c-di-GMP-specific phosphodiesterase class I)
MEAIELGAAGYLPKPVDLDMLISQIDRAKNLHDIARLQRQLRVEDERLDAERAELAAQFEEALAKCFVVFQPVVRECEEATAGWTVVGWEAYVRSAAPNLTAPSELIGAAVRLGRMQELGRRVRAICAETWARAPADALLFVNLHPLELEDEALAGPDSPLLPIAHRVVLEITERTFLSSVDKGVERISRLRELGFLLAIDDIGHGYASLNTCVNVEPDFIKLDRSLVAGIEGSPTQSRLVGAVADLARELGAILIAESVETVGELTSLRAMGCRSFQGHLFAAPSKGLPEPSYPASTRVISSMDAA